MALKEFESDYTNDTYTRGEFLKLIEKRIRKELRTQNLISLDKNYVVIDDGRVSSKLVVNFLESIFGGRLKLIVLDNEENIIEDSIVLSSDCLDEYVSKRLEVFFNQGDVSLLLQKKIMPLKVITKKEIEQLAKILSLEGKLPEADNKFIKALQDQYPQTKASLVKSFDYITSLNN